MEVVEFSSTPPLPIIVDSNDVQLFSLERSVDNECEVIVKPEEAGGTVNIYVL